MREIAFRAWDKHHNKMLYSDSFTLNGEPMSYAEQMRWFFFHTSNEQPADNYSGIMQYTGLKDKNGVEIYEGDIVRILYSDWMSKSEDDPRTLLQYQIEELCVVGTVVFRAPRFVGDLKDNLDCSLIAGEHGWIEVIGNIYENPNLLAPPTNSKGREKLR